MANVALCQFWCAWSTTRLCHRRLLFSHCSMSTHLASCDAFVAVTEDVGSDQVDPAKDKDDDASADNDTPECEAERLLAGGRFVEIAEHVHAEHDHGESESDEAMGGTEEWPVTSKIASEERELGCEEEH